MVFSMIMGFAAACQPAENDLYLSIEGMEQELKKDLEIDTALARSITAAYLEYAKKYPNDSLAPLYLSRAADILKEMPGKGLKAVNVYNDLSRLYPQHPLTPRAIFMIGYVFDEKYRDRDRAAKSYRYFIKEYPKHPLADDARNLLAMVEDTLTDEQQVAKWLEQSKKDTNQ